MKARKKKKEYSQLVQRKFVQQSRDFLVGDQFLDSCDLNA